MIWSKRTRGSRLWNEEGNCVPVHWPSSKRPLSVRTVVVEGVRHAILSLDDPLLRYQDHSIYSRPGSSPTSTNSDVSSPSSASNNELEECLIKLRVALDSSEETRLPPIDGTANSSPSCESILSNQSPCSSPAPVLPQNPLSERVLQWLDLANKEQSEPAPLLPKRPRNLTSCVKSTRPKKKLQTRSASMDIPQKSNTYTRKQSLTLSTASVLSIPKEELSEPRVLPSNTPMKQPQDQTPTVLPQRYEPLRPMSGWPSAAKPNRPQLHIFIPSLQENYKTDISDEFRSSFFQE